MTSSNLHGRLSTLHNLFGTLRMIPAILGRDLKDRSAMQAPRPSLGGKKRTASLLTIRENMRAMTRTHPQIAANLQNVIAASAGVETLELPIGEQPALPAPEDAHDEGDAVTAWFAKELVGITPASIRTAVQRMLHGRR